MVKKASLVRSRQVLIAVDQLVNALLFRGYADETLSARAYRNSAQGIPRWVRARRAIDAIFFWEKQHCRLAYESEVARLHMPPAYRSVYKGAE